MSTPITVFTGYLGAGKTSIIINLVKQLPPTYRTVLLKNEFGDVAVDAQLASANNIQVKEMVNGCLCCVLVGRMEAAINELIASYHPDRLFIETSGSAYPAPIAVQLHRMGEAVHLDAIVCVIDALNFPGYKDRSFTARAQLQYTDLILINKHELTDERRLEAVMDDLCDLNLKTPKIKTDHGQVAPDLIFGLDARLYGEQGRVRSDAGRSANPEHHQEVAVVEVKTAAPLDREKLEALLATLDPEEVYRVKGLIKTADGGTILNFVAGRWDWTGLPDYTGATEIAFIGAAAAELAQRLPSALGVPAAAVQVLA